MRTGIRWGVLVVVMGLLLLPIPAAGAPPFPDVIALPDGFLPEGIAIEPGGTFYVGSIPTGAIYRGDLRTGEGDVLVEGRAGASALGMKIDRKRRLFVAGGGTGKGYVYDARSGDLLKTYNLGTPGSSLINDVVVTKTAAFFTDSFQPFLYRVAIAPSGKLGPAQAIRLTGDLAYVTEPIPFNVNGIEATPDGSTLIVVQTNTGRLFRVDPSTAVTDRVELDGGDVAFGDGLLLWGKTLYVVRGFANEVTRVELSSDLSFGIVAGSVGDDDFDVPTTVARFGNRLYLPNARFNVEPTPTTDYWITRIARP